MNEEIFHDVNKSQTFEKIIFENISDDCFSLKYMNEIGHYSKTFTNHGDFWKENSKYFLDQFDVFKIVLQECFLKSNPSVSYDIINELNDIFSINIIHTSPIHLDWNISIILENDRYKIKILEQKIRSL